MNGTVRDGDSGLIWGKKLYVAAFSVMTMAGATFAEDKVLYCVVDLTVGAATSGDGWHPTYTDGSSGKRYTIRFSNDYAELSGVEATETPYYCQRFFPNKAPDVITCVNSRVATMVFNYSMETGHFVLSMVSPGGWLGAGAERAHGKDLLSDHLVLGKCQEF